MNPAMSRLDSLAFSMLNCERLVFLVINISDIDDNEFKNVSEKISRQYASSVLSIESCEIVRIIESEMRGRGIKYRVVTANKPSFK